MKLGTILIWNVFLPNQNFSAAIDMDFGPSGDLYVLEYGDAWFRKNSNSKLVKIEYNAGNRKPLVNASTDKKAGAIPFTAQFSSEGTTDYDAYDKNALKFLWEVKSSTGKTQTFDTPNPSVLFDQAGVYEASLTVTDSKNASNKASFEIVAGNAPPQVTIDFKGANRSFYFGDKSLAYEVTISDKEDGPVTDATEAAITFDYVPAGFDPIEVAATQSGADMLAIDAVGKNLIESSDCRSCHQYDAKSIGPSYTEVANKYPDTEENRALLIDRVINGSSGIWGDHAMAAHPELSEGHAARIVHFIMGITDEKPTIEPLPIAGELNPVLPEGEDGAGVYLLRAAYQDKGGDGLKPLAGEALIALRNPVLFPPFGDRTENIQYLTTPNINFFALGPSAHFIYSNIDLTGIKRIEIFTQVASRYEAHGGLVEMRLDSPTGKLIATSNKIGQKDEPRRRWGQNNKELSAEERKAKRRAHKQVLSLSFEPINTTHDVFFIFKNPEAANKEVMLSITEIEFYNTINEVQ